jgi:hypothetical protein
MNTRSMCILIRDVWEEKGYREVQKLSPVEAGDVCFS